MNLYIGNSSGDAETFDGTIDEVRFYNKSLIENEVKSLYLYPSGIQQQGVASNKGLLGGWTITASTIINGNVTMDAANEQILLGAATAPLTGIGVFLGKDGSDYEFRAGDPDNAYTHWNGTKWMQSAPAGSDYMEVKGGIIHGSFLLRGDNDAGGGSAPVIKQVFTGQSTANNDYIYIVYNDSTNDGRIARYNRTKANAIFRDIDDIDIYVGGANTDYSGCYNGTYIYLKDNGATAFRRMDKDLTNASNSNSADLATLNGGTFDGTYACFVRTGTSLRRYTFSGAPWDFTLFDTITLSNAISGSLCWNATNSMWYGYDSATGLIRKFNATGTQQATLSIAENVVGVLVLEGKLFVAYNLIDPVVSSTSKWVVQCVPFDF